jgi:two-component system sensor histidine kinase DesK
MRLNPLPPDEDLGWFPYAPLTFLAFLIIGPALGGITAVELAVTLLGVFVFLVTYFWSYWLPDGRPLFVPLAVFAVVGVALSSINDGANVFFFYAAYLAGWMGRPLRTLLLTAMLLSLLTVCFLAFDTGAIYLLTGVVVSIAVAAAGLQTRSLRQMNLALARSQRQVEELARVAERERVARDLHDSLGRELTAISLKAELASRLAARDRAAAVREVGEISRIARTALDTVRRQLADDAHLVLAEELERAEHLLSAAGIRAELHVAGARPALDARRETALCFVLREAVTNVVRHARASSCRITVASSVRQTSPSIVLTVEDDGVGAGSGPGADRGMAREGGVGIASMRARVHALDGQFDLSADAGTRLRVCLPVVAA